MKKTTILLLILFSLTLTLYADENGENGKSSLLIISDEPEGENCENGGKKIVTGFDLNENGILDYDEIEQLRYICNGVDGSGGHNALIETGHVAADSYGDSWGGDSTPPSKCPNGGTRIVSGIDLNDDGELTEDEITNAQYYCEDYSGGCSSILSLSDKKRDNGPNALLTAFIVIFILFRLYRLGRS